MYCIFHSRQFLKWDTGTDTAVSHSPHRKCWSAPMTAEGVGVDRDSLVSKSNKPACDTAVTGQPDNATHRAKQIGLTHTGCLLLIMLLAITKQMTTSLQVQPIHSWHIVIYIIIIYHPLCGSLIYWLVFGLCVMHAHLKTRGNCIHSHISVYGPPLWLCCCQC